jgi:hypothetical protein
LIVTGSLLFGCHLPFHLPPIIEYRDSDLDVHMYFFLKSFNFFDVVDSFPFLGLSDLLGWWAFTEHGNVLVLMSLSSQIL